MKNITINKNINRHIPIISSRIFSSKNIPKTPLPQNNKQHIPNSSIYLDRFKSQLKKFDMYKEMWDKSKSFSEEDMLGIAQTIQINSENIQNNFRANATSTRKNSAMTFNDLSYKSKRRVKNIKTNNNYNLGQMDREKSNYLNMKTNTKNKLRTNIFFDLFHDKESTINMSNYNSTLQTNNKNFLSTELNQLHNLIEANKSNNKSKKQEYFNYGVPKRDFNKKEIVIINENKKTIEENDDKNNLEKLVRENSSSTLNLRTDYLIRFSKLLGLAKKFIYSMDFFRIEKRDIFSLYMKNLTEAFDSCNDFFINQIKEGDILDNNTWSIILSQYYNLSFHVIKFQNYAFKEMQFLKNENLSFKQKLYSVEGELNIKKKDINDINKYILQYDLVNKVKYKKKREMTIKEIKSKYNMQESAYILKINKLEEEIKQLTEVLNQNKFDVNNFKEVSEKLKNLKEEFEENKNDFDNQNSQKNVTIKVLSHANIDLNEKINELEAEIQKYKEKEEDTKRQFIEYEAKLKNLNDIIHQKNILIEELKAEKIIIKEKSTDENKVLPELEATFLSPQGNLRKKYNKKYQPSTDT
jgi:hypothetical protein